MADEEPTCIAIDEKVNHQRLLLHSRVVDVPRACTPTCVALSFLKPFFFNGLQKA
jgi:hypothetical protein